MIKNLEIKNFKSLKHLKLDCKKVNVFIGKPNTGKSNLLESLGIFFVPFELGRLKKFIRLESMTNLFYDQDISNEIQITADNVYCTIKFENGDFIVKWEDKEKEGKTFCSYNYSGSESSGVHSITSPLSFKPFKFYKFSVINQFPRKEFDFLWPPEGDNLLQILLINKNLRRLIADIFGEFGFRIVLKPQENKIEVQKEIEDNVIISYPYSLVSDTLQRVVFHLVAVETNKNSIIIFEEPEAHAFPYYTKFLAERIAFDETNQYFISTHNPYFLLSILEKTSVKNMGIFITYFEDYQTKVKSLKEEELSDILDLDASIFFNLDKFLEKEK